MSVDVLAVGAHPDDVEIACGGTLARCAAAGRRVAVAHLTRGEAGTRGTPEERVREAEAAAAALGVEAPRFLDLGDGGLRTDRAAEDAVVALLRELRPRLLLIPPAVDRHPDHERAHRVVRDAAFYAGLVKRGGGPAHRPAALWETMLHGAAEPDLVVDVSDVWARKERALDAYASQLAPRAGAATPGGPETLVSRPSFRSFVEARARVLGQAIGARYGEGFRVRGPVAVDPLAWLDAARGGAA
jgi:bacillithiol biosynthesis deacetylase BshB1